MYFPFLYFSYMSYNVLTVFHVRTLSDSCDLWSKSSEIQLIAFLCFRIFFISSVLITLVGRGFFFGGYFHSVLCILGNIVLNLTSIARTCTHQIIWTKCFGEIVFLPRARCLEEFWPKYNYFLYEINFTIKWDANYPGC